MNKLLCSTGALITGRNNRNHMLLAMAGQELTCEGYEFMMYQAWLWQGPVKHIHIGDFAGEPMDWESLRSCKHPREGKIDFEKFFAHLKKVGYDGTVTVESTAVAEDGSMLTDKLNDTFAYLRSLM